MDNIETIKTAAKVIVAIAVLVGSIWAVPAYIATAADLQKVDDKITVLAQAKATDKQLFNIELQTQLNKQSIRDLKGKLADVEDKPTKTNVDITKKDRLLREIAEIQRENETLQRQKFLIETKKTE